MRLLTICMFKKTNDATPKIVTSDWGTLAALLTTHKISVIKDTEAIGFYGLRDGTTRASENVTAVHALALDFDKCVPYERVADAVQEYEHIFHTTFSHSPGCPKGRLVLPLSRAATPEEWPHVWAGAYILTHELADTAARDAARMFYLPRCPESNLKDKRAFHNSGKWIDTDHLIELGKSAGKASARVTAPKTPPSFPAVQPLIDNFDEPRIRGAFEARDWDDREAWLQAGMALHSTGKGEEAYALWTEYSKRSPKFDAQDQRKTWDGFKIGRNNSVTLATLFYKPVAPRVIAESRPEKSELGLAERFIARHQREVRFVSDESVFILWNGNTWERDHREQAATQRMIETVKAIPATEVPELMGKDNTEAEKVSKWAIRDAQKAATMTQALKLASAHSALAVKSGALDANPELFQCANGIVNLKTRRFSDSNADALHTLASPANYEGEAKCPRWMQFLDEVTGSDESLKAFLRRIVGYTLSGKTDEQCLFFLYGLGANGKSVFLNVLRELLGTYSTTASADSFMMQHRNASSASPEIAALAFRRLVCVTEIPQGQRLDEARIKSLTGGEQITARQLYRGQFTFEPRCKLWFAGNYKPAIRGSDHGIWRRIQLIPFTAQIPDEKKDPQLLAKLRAELPGILNWALDGYSEYVRIGLLPPKVVLDEVQSYRGEEDILGDWISACCNLSSDGNAPREGLYLSYQQFCARHATRAVGNKNFYSSLRSRGLTDAKVAGKRAIRGISLLENATTNRAAA